MTKRNRQPKKYDVSDKLYWAEVDPSTAKRKVTPKLPWSACLSCGKHMDEATSLFSKAAPAPDDITICQYCGHVMAFADSLTLRALTVEEMKQCLGDPRVTTIQRALEVIAKFRVK